MLISSRVLLIAILIAEVLTNVSESAQQTTPDFLFEDSIGQWNLNWSVKEKTLHNLELLMQCYETPRGKYGDPDVYVTMHLKTDDRLTWNRIVYSYRSSMWDSYVNPPRFFTYKPEGDSVRQQFFLLREDERGTGNFNVETICHIDSTGRVTKLVFWKDTSVVFPQLEAGQSIKKGGGIGYCPDSLFFVGYVWNEGDGNCCPSGGRITANIDIKVDPESGERYVITESYVLAPYVHPIDESRFELPTFKCW